MVFLNKLFSLWGIIKLFIIAGLLFIIIFFILMWWANAAAQSAGKHTLYNEVDNIPDEENKARVALVFGCAEKIRGRTNLYFQYRINAAYKLWQAGKVRGFITSGDNSRDDYNEPLDMKKALISMGVPADKIVCDYAGLRTMDSVIRAQKIFNIDKVILVSQKFHNERAIYISQKRGLDAIGYNAQDVKGKSSPNREYLARIRMWVDENILKTTPKYLGEEEQLTF